MGYKFSCLLFAVALLLVSCNENEELGMTVLPAEDVLSVVSDSFHIRSVVSESVGDIYSETTKPVLGTYRDELYGAFSVDFVSEFRYVNGLEFPEGTASDSLYLVMYYLSFVGDSNAVHEATVYALDENLEFNRNFTINTDISEICSKSEILGKASYVAYDRTITDSVRSLSGYCDKVMIKLSDELAAGLIADPTLMESQSNFTEYLKGVYVANTYGSQTVLEIDSVNLELYYHYPPDLDNLDSLVYTSALFPANLESTTFVHITDRTNPQLESLPDSLVSMSSPGGVMLKFEMPWERMYERIYGAGTADGVNINHASIIMEVRDLESYTGELEPPEYVMMIREEDVEAFFTQSLYPASGIYTYLGMYDEDTASYTFANMADFIQETLDDGPDGFDAVGNLVILPVGGTTDVAGTDASIYHSMSPSGAVFGSGTNEDAPFRLILTYTDL